MDQKLAIGVVGLGGHAQRGHIDHLQLLDRAEITAACDPSEEARRRQRAAGFTLYETLDALLDHEPLDALVICSPDRFHTAALCRAVDRGLHVLVEKPVADTRQDLIAVIDALAQAKEKRLVVSSCHPRRFDPPFRWIKSELSTLRDQLGGALELRFDFFYHKPSKEGLHHGLLSDHINHEIDLVNWLFGYSPFAAYRLYDSEIRYAAAGAREDGLTFTFSGSRQLRRRVYSELLRIRFERGEVEIDTESGMAVVRNWDINSRRAIPCGRTDYTARFQATNRDFVTAALDGTSPYLADIDLVINTEVGVALTEDGSYDSRQSPAISLVAGSD